MRYFCPTITCPISCLSNETQDASFLIFSCSSGAGGVDDDSEEGRVKQTYRLVIYMS